MTKTSLVDADSLLALEVGTIHTNASLFDMVDGRYRCEDCGADLVDDEPGCGYMVAS